MSSLFRQEALEAKRTQWLGSVSIAHGPRLWILGALALSAAVGIALLLTFGEYTRRTRVGGEIVPSSGLVTLHALTDGVVSNVGIVEGGNVNRGAFVARIEVPSATDSQENALRAVDEAIRTRSRAITEGHEADVAQLRSLQESLRQQRDAIQGELIAIGDELESRRGQLSLAEEAEERTRELYARKFVTPAQWQDQQSRVFDQRATIQKLRRESSQLQRQLAAVTQQLASIPDQIDAQIASTAQSLASLGQERLETERRQESVLSSPLDGTVAALLVQRGQSVRNGQAIAAIVPLDSRLEAHLLVPSRAVGFIERGDAVRLRFQAFPYQKFGQGRGTVERVSQSALSPSDLSALGVKTSASEPLYRVVVRLEQQSVLAFGKEEPLKPGMVLEADVLGERRRLWEWALEPVFSVQGRAG